MTTYFSFSSITKAMHDLTTLIIFGVSIALIVTCFSTDSAKMPLYLTQTFLTTYYNHQPALTWSQPTDPMDNHRVASTFFKCLRVAGVGIDPSTNCVDMEDDAKFTTCLHNQTTSGAYIKKRLEDDLKKAAPLAKNEAQVNAVAAKLPTLPLFTDNTPVETARLKLSLIDNYLAGLDTPYARQVRKVYAHYSHWQGIQGCIDQADINGGITNSIQSTYDDLWRCATDVLPTTQDQAYAFQQCVPLSAWPAQDELQTVYSLKFLGSYNFYFLAVMGTWVFTSFAVYTFWPGHSKSSSIGRPLEWFGWTGVGFTALCALWNGFGGIITVVASAYLGGDKQHGFPMTIQTLLITGAVTVAATGYFLRDFWEQIFHMEPNAPYMANITMKHQIVSRGRPLVPLGGYARIGHSSEPLNDDQAAPWVVFPWSDACLLSDGLLLLAIVGTSSDVVTADAGRIFLAATYAAAGQSAFIRLFYEAHYSGAAADPKPRMAPAQNTEDKRPVRVMVFIVQMAIFWFALENWLLLFFRYSNATIISFAILTSLLPMLLWLIFSLVVEFNEAASLSLTTFAQIVFLYNTIIRSVFMLVLMTTATANADPNSTLHSLIKLLEA